MTKEDYTGSIAPDGDLLITPPEIVPLSPWKEYPFDQLPEPLRSLVVEGVDAIGCDPSYIALPMLSAVGAMIGNARRLVVKSGWVVPPIVWTAIVGESGTAKTPAFSVVTAPIESIQADAYEAASANIERHHQDVAAYDKGMAAWKKDKKTDDPPPVKPDPPEPHRLIVTDTTMEALAPILMANPKGVLLARDELAGWLGSFDAYKSGSGSDAANWLSLYSAKTITVDRKTGTPRTIHVRDPLVCVTGGIQPGILARALGREHRESGMAARLLLSCPPRSSKRWSDRTVGDDTMRKYERLIRDLVDMPMDTDDTDRLRPRYIGMTGDAKAAYEWFYNSHNSKQSELSGDLAAAWSKLEEIPLRLGLIIHCVRMATGDISGDKFDADTLGAAIAITRWHCHETRRVYAIMDESETDSERRQLLDWIVAKGGTITARELQQGRRDIRTSAEADATLTALTNAGLGEWESIPPGDAGGRATRRFHLSTASTVYATPSTPEENIGFVDVDSAGSHESAESDADDEIVEVRI
jgi:hypothetical protein